MMQDREGKYYLNDTMQSLYDSWEAAQSEDVVDANSESSSPFRIAQDRKQALTKVKNTGVSKLFASAFDKLPQSMREDISSKQMSREDFDAEKASLDVFSSIADKIEKQGFDALSEDEKQAWSTIKQATNEQLGLSTEISDSDMNYLLWRADKADSKDLVDQAELKSREHEFLNQYNNEFKDTDMAKPKPTIRHITEESGIRFRTETPQQSTTRFRLGDSESFEARQKRAVENKGTVTPGLAEMKVEVVSVPKHEFTGTGKQAIEKARSWAIDNLVGEHTANEGTYSEFKYAINEDVISKYLSKSSTKGSDNLGIHIAVLKELKSIINASVEVEEHPNYKKVNQGRSFENGLESEDILMHRFYGAVTIDGHLYRVKTSFKEMLNKNHSLPYNYQVTELELLISGSQASNALSNSSSLSLAKLLQGVEKSYDKGKKILDESENRDNNEETDPEDDPDGPPSGGGSPAPTDFASSVRFRIGTPSAA